MLRKLKYLTILFSVVLIVVLLNKSATAAPPTVAEPTISPAGPATMQTKTIPVWGESDAKPGVYWQQLDNGDFRATTANGSKISQMAKDSDPAYPEKHAGFYNFEIDMSPYIPKKFSGADFTSYSPDLVVTKALAPGNSEYVEQDFRTYEAATDTKPTILVGGNAVKVSVKTGGNQNSGNTPIAAQQRRVKLSAKFTTKYQ